MQRISFVALLIIILAFQTAAGCAREIWFSPLDPLWRQIRHWPASDYMQLFEPNSAWRSIASVLTVFELSKRFVREAPDADLARVVAGLRERNLAISVQATPLVASVLCGLGIEGHGPPHDMLAVAQRLQTLGADLRYLTFDEPLYYGHEFDGRPGLRPCHTPIAVMAEQAAAKIAEVKQIFPAVRAGGVEPFGIPRIDERTWAAHLNEWLKAYADAAGAPLAFLHADILWRRANWRAQFLNGVEILRSLRIPLGVIYNSSPDVSGDHEWTEMALDNARAIECELQILPEQSVFQSWTDRPRKILPETEPATFTNLVHRYVRRPPCS